MKTAGSTAAFLADLRGKDTQMTAQQSTLKPDEIQAPTINDALNLRWKYFKSRSGDILAKTYASDALTHLSGFIEISAAEYARLEQEQKS